MIKSNQKAVIKIFAMPMASCDPGKTWKAAFEFLSQRLHARYGNRIEMEFIEIFSPQSFAYPDIIALLEYQKKPPFITVNGKVFDCGGKLSERIIRNALEDLAITPDSDIGHSE